MAKRMAISTSAKSPNWGREEMYVDGRYIGYFDVKMSYMRTVLDALSWRRAGRLAHLPATFKVNQPGCRARTAEV